MDKKEIASREDIYLLVLTFYDRIKKDDLIGPIFIEMIPEKEWGNHLIKLTDFWETNLFFVRKFKGNPVKVHKNLDKSFKYSISQKHFGRWLQLWFSTIDELFVGEKAFNAKERARNIASMLFFKIFDSRP
ncbi:group III truncated hemoglobin [Tenacibaculum sp. C7A-26P2]|uniref:group III truncated hemoglobin n=1 Tax=Tenacibaculum sp. C7A-26P2 TaxID=3447504 RepID=UPI003F84B26E